MAGLKWGHRLSLFVLVVMATAARGQLLSYNMTTKQLHLRCPKTAVVGDIMLIQLSRVDPEIPLANWTREGAFAENGRITTLAPTPPYLLEAVMDHVTCGDTGRYRCAMLVDSDTKGVHTVPHEELFTYQGEVTTPVSSKEPMKSRYQKQEEVKLQCTARIGKDENDFVWETRLPGENFTIVTEDGKLCKKIEQETMSQACELKATTTLKLELSDNDDGREWRCRLKKTDHEALFTVAVDCQDDNGCLVPCRTERPEAHEHGVPMSTPDGAIAGDVGRVGQSVNKKSEESGDDMTKMVMIIVLPVTFTISVIAVVTVCKKRREKQLPPLVVMESPPETEYGDSTTSSLFPIYSPAPSRASRRLPDLPPEVNRHSDSTYITADDGEDDTPKKLISPYEASRPSSSVYVSMSAINTLESTIGDRLGNGMGPVRGGQEERGIPAFERSMSVYSNSSAIADAARSRANSADGGTQMRVHATFKKELA